MLENMIIDLKVTLGINGISLLSWSPFLSSLPGWWVSPSPPQETWWPAVVWITSAQSTTSRLPAQRPSGSWMHTQVSYALQMSSSTFINENVINDDGKTVFLTSLGYLSCCRFLSDSEILTASGDTTWWVF